MPDGLDRPGCPAFPVINGRDLQPEYPFPGTGETQHRLCREGITFPAEVPEVLPVRNTSPGGAIWQVQDTRRAYGNLLMIVNIILTIVIGALEIINCTKI
jgi:hypothetical protein